ncbi:HPP family protein [Methylobacterium sp. WSM2598]|uniref:HPP family protein n=1 Tax=Methylobacterium sp. WSM2598 TaxID=398261 RepID=UPI0003654F5C|nr:HPP family protein [Methylobacterium sp. WSM2598]
MLRRLRRFLPDLTPVSLDERLHAAIGALAGILATGLMSRAALGDHASLPVLIAPMGASAVLLFAVPASPLAQPWSILGGNTVAALIGVTAATQIADPFVAAVAVSVAIAVMTALRCVHPPSGAVALTAVLGGPAIHELGYGFVLWPVGLNSLILLTTAILFNNFTGRSYPHRAPQASPAGRGAMPAPFTSLGFTGADLDAALEDFGEFVDIGRADLDAILHHALLRASRRALGSATCASVLSRAVVGIAPDASLDEALALFRRRRIRALAVTDEGARVVGLLTHHDLIDKAAWNRNGPRLDLPRRLRLTLARGRAPHHCVADVMTTPVIPVRPETPLADAALWMSQAGLVHLPVVGPDDRLIGLVSQGDVVNALLVANGARAGGPVLTPRGEGALAGAA